jgi:hypothetical protein
MVNEADRFAGEDKARREAVEARNSAESMVYQTEKQIKELGDKVSGSLGLNVVVGWLGCLSLTVPLACSLACGC